VKFKLGGYKLLQRKHSLCLFMKDPLSIWWLIEFSKTPFIYEGKISRGLLDNSLPVEPHSMLETLQVILW
jgi:hypothetical protein